MKQEDKMISNENMFEAVPETPQPPEPAVDAEDTTSQSLVVAPSGEGWAYWMAGDRVTILVTGNQTGGAYAFFDAFVVPEGGMPPHIHHREAEAFYVLEGTVTFQVGERTFPAHG